MLQFRLIYDTPASGKRNMAVDEAILTAVMERFTLPTLRLYAWEPACLSLGYGQSWQDADLERIDALGWQAVRRITGGRAILHTDELTYSITVPEGHPLAEGSILESYQRISRALMRALEILGMSPKSERKEGHVRANGPVCFEVPSHYEITTEDGRKLVGSAQYRRKGAVLQHGSLPIYGDVGRICDALYFESDDVRERAKSNVRRRAATLEEAFGGHIFAWEEVADAVANGFAQVFDAELIEQTLSAEELDYVDELVHDVYGQEAWTQKR